MYQYIVIDDEELTRKGTIAKLKPISQLVTCAGEANDGQEALALIEQSEPEIIITDMNMPNMDGTMLLPILTERYPEKTIIIISGYKDFEYTKHAIKAKAIDYLLKPFSSEDIQTSIKNAIAQMEDQLLTQNRLINSEAEKERVCYEHDLQTLKNAIMGLHFENILFSSKKLSHMNQTYKINLMTLHSIDGFSEETMQNYLSENGFGDLALYLQNTNNKHLGFLILFVPEHSVLKQESLCMQIARGLIHHYTVANISISIGISRSHNELARLHTAYSETVQALNSKKISDRNQYYFFTGEDVKPLNLRWNKEDELLFRIEAGMCKETEQLVHELFEYFAAFPESQYADVKYYCFQLSDSIRRMLANYIEQITPEGFSSSTQNILNNIFDLKELKNYHLQAFTNIANILRVKGEYANSNIIEKIITYTQKNYQKDLSIELFSCFFYMSRSYLSHLFKEKTGIKYVDYLNQIRIEHAMTMLVTTDKKMYQIAKSVGYDVKYFFRVFKKRTRQTPDEWRMKHRQEQKKS